MFNACFISSWKFDQTIIFRSSVDLPGSTEQKKHLISYWIIWRYDELLNNPACFHSPLLWRCHTRHISDACTFARDFPRSHSPHNLHASCGTIIRISSSACPSTRADLRSATHFVSPQCAEAGLVADVGSVLLGMMPAVPRPSFQRPQLIIMT